MSKSGSQQSDLLYSWSCLFHTQTVDEDVCSGRARGAPYEEQLLDIDVVAYTSLKEIVPASVSEDMDNSFAFCHLKAAASAAELQNSRKQIHDCF